MIRVKEFARLENLQKEEENENKTERNKISRNLVNEIETISLSSEDDMQDIGNELAKRCTQKLKKKQPKLASTVNRNRTPKPPLKYKYHKISEYFQATKNDTQIGLSTFETTTGEKENQITDVGRYKSELRQVKIVLRRLSIEQKVETTRKRKPQDDQSKMPDYVEYSTSGEKYFTIHSQSSFPSGVSPHKNFDLDEKKPKTESISNKHTLDHQNPKVLSKEFRNIEEEKPNNKLNTEIRNHHKSTPAVTSKIKKNQKGFPKKGKRVICPDYKIIEGTKFAVDAFRYGDIENVEHYFLTHFHADHYIGLKKGFNHKLYVSNITGRLVVDLIKVQKQYVHCLDINSPTIINEIEVILLDANHCPGAVMFLFKLKTGKCILHTGDFRASPDMEEYPEFWNNEIHTIYLDTTYLSSKYDFSTQSDSISLIIQYCYDFINSSTSSSSKPLIICGAYKVGKEKVWLRIAQEFNYKVWINEERKKVMNCVQNTEISEVLTRSATDASIHVLPLGSISYPFISQYVNQFRETFSKILAIRPSGWEREKSKPNFANQITILGVQYSEHSSYSELERFVRFLQPHKVISTVPFSSNNMSKTPKVPDSWLDRKIEPKPRNFQSSIMNFMVKQPNVIQRQDTPNTLNIHQKPDLYEEMSFTSINDDLSDDFLP